MARVAKEFEEACTSVKGKTVGPLGKTISPGQAEEGAGGERERGREGEGERKRGRESESERAS
eukprot:3746490-Rhodomonas_salina.1